jgi:nitrous oxide reductase accessory protein NosL
MDKPWTIKLAETEKAESCETEMTRLLELIGAFMEPSDPRGWASHCWVSDMSCLSDFDPNQADMQQIRAALGFDVNRNDYLVDIAKRMQPATEL